MSETFEITGPQSVRLGQTAYLIIGKKDNGEVAPVRIDDDGNVIVSGDIGFAIPSGSGNLSVQTSATGTQFVDLADQDCKRVTMFNATDANLEVRQGGSGVSVVLFSGSFFTFSGIENASDLSIRRVDNSNTQVTLVYRWDNIPF